MHTVEIDFEVYKEITARRSSEHVTPNDVLREALGLPKQQTSGANPENRAGGRPWTSKGVTFPQGTEFRATHKGQTYKAVVQDGALVLNGERFSSPSAAAVSITGNPVNGWVFWESRMPGKQAWELIKSLR
ncbi:MAG: DUF2924 domain-containing protein [Syntrophobacteraceae bacterium]